MGTDGREIDALAGAQTLFQTGQVHLAIVRTQPGVEDLTSGVHRQGFRHLHSWLQHRDMLHRYTMFPAQGEAVLVQRGGAGVLKAVHGGGGRWMATARVLMRRNLNYTGVEFKMKGELLR